MLELTGALADGWSVSAPYVPPDEIPPLQARINAAALRAGRNTQDIRRGYNLMGAIDLPTGPRITATRKGAMHGTVAVWVDTLASYYRDLGMDTFFFWPLGGNEEEQARIFAEEVIPGVRQALGVA
jgi:hypothetical protein